MAAAAATTGGEMPLMRSLAALVLAPAFAGVLAAEPPAPAPTGPAAPPAARPAEATENRVVTTEPVHAIVLPMTGSYEQHPAALERLAGYLAGKGVAPVGAPFARYLSDPSAGEAQLRWEVGFPVAPGAAAEAPFEVRDLPASLSAVHVHRAPYDELAAAWPAFVQWILANGYQPAGPPMQLFSGDLAAPEVEMRMPVRR
jgi:effector-binding domain-containing protein